LISEMIKRANETIGDNLLAVSDNALDFIVLETFTEPQNAAQIEKLQEPKESKVAFTTVLLITRIFRADPTCFWNRCYDQQGYCWGLMSYGEGFFVCCSRIHQSTGRIS
jgi:hypothetical protein